MSRTSNFRLFDFIYKVLNTWPDFQHSLTQLTSLGQWEKWQDRVFEDLTDKKILEIGVGPGKLLRRLAQKGYSVTGIELRHGMADDARRRIKKAGFDVDILTQSIYKLPFKNEVFDCIVMTFILGEIDDLDKAILEMKRVLKKSGKVVVIAGGMPQDKNFVAKFLFMLVKSHTSLRLERDNVAYFSKHGFQTNRVDFGPFYVINKIVAVKQ